MRRRDAVLALGTATVIVIGMLTVFALELSNTQAKSQQDVKARVHERAVLAAALIDSLFQSVGRQIPQDVKTYGAREVTNRAMARNSTPGGYSALLSSNGGLLAASPGFTAQARAGLASSDALALIRGGHQYALGDLLPYGHTGVINLAVGFPTRFGTRILVTGFFPGILSAFIGGELVKVPGVRGSNNYLIDGHDAVVASTSDERPVGYVFHQPAQIKALARSSADVNGVYYDQVGISNSTWRVVLSAPNGPLFASVSGLRKAVPWIIFAAFALVALAALGLGRRALRSADQIREANARLKSVNDELADTNTTLERRAAELARSNSELDQFAAIASHDLQEPLRKIRTFTQQLTVIEAEHLSEKGRDYLGRANAAAERMQKLIEDLLKFSRVATQGRAFAPVDLGRLAREVIGDLEAQVQLADAQVTLGTLPTVNGDSLQMRQLLQNLLSNALKFRRADIATKVALAGTVLSGDVAEITVRDNGIGFDPQYSRRIFRVFERLHGRSTYPGTGIGLALCRKIVERHGGTILADSEPGGGSTFTVRMPVHQPDEIVAAGHDAREDLEPVDKESYAAV